MKKGLLIVCLSLMAALGYSQEKTITGKITDASDKTPMFGVNVVVKGTATGTTTDADGNFTLKVPEATKKLTISYISKKTQEVDISSATAIAVVMEDDALNLDQVVITAYSIKREKKSLGYTATTLTAKDITKAGSTTLLSGIQGKVAGANISNASGAPGSSTRLVLRGPTSLLGNNEALTVIDGIIMDNSSIQTDDNLNNQVDFGNRLNDLNPDDIESITVLKGQSATALYGSQASTGALVITTKNGLGAAARGRKFEVSYNTSLQFQNILKLPEFQNSYGQGGEFEPDSRENFSWGPKFDGQTRPWGQAVDGKQRVKPYSAVPNNVKNFFNTGTLYTNTLSVSGGKENVGYYFSFGNVLNKGVMPTTEQKRYTFRLGGNFNLSDKFSTNATIFYAKTNGRNTIQGQSTSVYDNVVQTPRDIPIAELKDYNSPFNDLAGYYGAYTDNPYFLLGESKNTNEVDNLLGSVALSYKPITWLDITGRFGTNVYTDKRYQQIPKYEVIGGQNDGKKNIGQYSEDITKFGQYQSDIIVSAQKNIGKMVSLGGLLGNNIYAKKTTNTYASTAGLVVPGFYSLSNSSGSPTTSNALLEYRLTSIFGGLNFGLKDLWFVEFNFRNEWSSTLPKGKNSYFYPSVSTALVFSDLIPANKIFTYGKLRLNYAMLGKDASPYLLSTGFRKGSISDNYNNTNLNFPVNGVPGFERGDRIGNSDLKPEKVSTYEAGLELAFWDNRIGIDATYYYNINERQIITADLPASTGYTSITTNLGKMRNQGVELLFSLTPIRNLGGFTWDLSLNFAKNWNKVVSLKEGLDQVVLGSGTVADAVVVASVGRSYGTFYAVSAQRDPDGNVVVDASGMPVIDPIPHYLGSYLPDYTMSLSNTFRFKGFELNLLLDGRKGGTMYSRTKDVMEFVGTSPNTLYNDRQPFVIPNSVVQNADGTFSPNTTAVPTAETYWIDQLDQSANMIDASYFKIREISLSYTFPHKFFVATPIRDISLGFVGRNLFVKTHKDNTFVDPETSSFGNSNAQGYEYSTIPSVRTLGVNLKVNF